MSTRNVTWTESKGSHLNKMTGRPQMNKELGVSIEQGGFSKQGVTGLNCTRGLHWTYISKGSGINK